MESVVSLLELAGWGVVCGWLKKLSSSGVRFCVDVLAGAGGALRKLLNISSPGGDPIDGFSAIGVSVINILVNDKTTVQNLLSFIYYKFTVLQLTVSSVLSV